MGGNKYTPRVGLSDEEQLRQEAEAAAAYDAAIAAAQARAAPPPAGPPAGPPAPPAFEAFGVRIPTSPPVIKQAPPPIEMPPSEEKGVGVRAPIGPTKADDVKPPVPTTDPGVDLSPGPQGSSGGMVIPGGMMPAGLNTTVHQGKPVPDNIYKAYDDATGMQAQAAAIQRNADAKFFDESKRIAGLKIQAADQAALDHQKLAEERDAVVSARLNEIEALNKKAAGRPEDLWNSEVAFGRFLSFAFMALGVGLAGAGKGLAAGLPVAMGGKFIDGLINEDIQSKLDQREQAGKLAGRQTNLLNLYEEKFKDKGKAIDATKLAYYDSALAQLDRVKSELGADANDARYLDLQGQLLAERAKVQERLTAREAPDVAQEFSQRYRAPQFYGGQKQPGIRDDELVITIPASDKTGEHETHVAVPKDVHAHLSKMQGATNALVQLDREALKARAELREAMAKKDIHGVATARAYLQKLQKDRIYTEQKASDEGVTRDADFKQAMKMGTDYTAGIAGDDFPVVGVQGDKLIQRSMNQTQAVTDAHIRGASGWTVVPQRVTEKGAVRPGWAYTGNLYRGRGIPSEGGEVK